MPRPPATAVLTVLVLVVLASGARGAHAVELTVADVVRLALAHNERSGIARLNVVTADAAVVRARAQFLPAITLSGSETLRPLTPSNGASGVLAVNQPLLALSALPLYAAARRGQEAARSSEVDLRRQLAFDAARSFFTVIAQQNLFAAAEQRLERATTSLSDMEARARAQLSSSNDVTRSRVERANAAQSVATLRGNLKQGRIALEYLIDTALPATLRASTGHLGPASPDPAPLVAEAVRQRPDLTAARASAAQAAALAEEPKRRFIPTLGSTAQLRVADSLVSGRYWDATLAFTLSWSIWDAGLRGADEASRLAAAQTAQLQVKALQRRVQTDVRSAVTSLITARESLLAAAQGVAAARQNAEESTILYKQGLAKAIELVDSNLSRFNAETTLAAAQLAVHQAELDLRSALGLFPVDGVK